MKHNVHPCHSPATHVRLAQVAHHEVDIARHAGDIGLVPRAEVVDHAYWVSKRNEPLDQI